MKRTFLTGPGLLLACASLVLAQGTAPPPPDPQRPDGNAPAAAAEQESEEKQNVPFDPQRPDAEPPADAKGRPSVVAPRRINLTLTPAAETVPALKHELLPRPIERTPGNGATNYYRAMLHAQQVMAAVSKEEREKYNAEYDNWMNGPLQELPKTEMQVWVGHFAAALKETKEATYREQCDWDLRLQDLRGLDTIGFLLHDFQQSRELARVLKLRARLEVSDGKLNEALETTRQGFQLARDTSEPELIINALIGIAIASMMQEELIEIIDQPGSPNLYWSIASLPRPLVDIRRGLRFEMEMPERMFPFLQDAETAERTPEEWQRLMTEAVRDIAQVGGTNLNVPEWQTKLAATAGLMMVYPDAKKRLLEDGFDKERLEKMPAAQVVAIQTSRAQKQVYHNVFKWSSLPYSQQGNKMDESLKAMIAEMGGPGKLTAADPLLLARLLLPALQAAMFAEIRLQSHFAAIQTIEALRMHAAANGGQLPRSLDEITVVPVPLNPATDKPFFYDFADGVGILKVSPPPGQGGGHWSARTYVIQMERK